MSSWFSNALSATTKGITSLKSSLLGSEADGDTEDDTHVCRVLRAYYNEKGRPLPPWLPPDPKAPAAASVMQPSAVASSRYGGLSQGQASTAGGGGLSSLWDNNSSASQQQIPQSLRPGGGRAKQGTPSPFATADSNRPSLPAQRSYSSGPTPPGSSSGNISTADKLRQRLKRGAASGARTASPADQSAFAPPPSQSTSGSFSRSSGGRGDYDDMYNSGNSGQFGGGGGRSGGDQPYVSANAPWVTDGSGGGGGGGGGRSGLPSGPRRGLPSGPRMR